MKKLFIGLSLFLVGCAYNSNQKTSAPFLGSVHNEYYIITINVNGEDELKTILTNMSKRCVSSDSTGTKTSKILLGRGSEIFAIDNQVLIGHDFGNSTSNDISGTLSIPISN